MRTAPRRLIALAAGLALAGGALTAGSTAASAAVGDPVQAVNAYGVTYGFVIEWQPPADLTGVTGYTVGLVAGFDAGATPVTTRTVAVTNPDIEDTEFTGLTAGSAYTGWVVAKYGDIDSPRTDGPSDIVYKPLGKPGLKVTPANKALTVAWTAPKTDADTGQVAFYEIAVGDFVTPVQASTRSIKVPGLTNGKRYPVAVRAWATDPGATASGTGTPYGAPGKPTDFKRSWKSGGKAKLSWAGVTSTHAAPVTGYVVYVNGKKVATLPRTARTVVVSGQKKGKYYSFAVRAKNDLTVSPAATIASKKRPIS